MPPAEVAGRLRHELLLVSERLQHRTIGLRSAARLRRSLGARHADDWEQSLLDRRRRARPPFFRGAEDRDDMRTLLRLHYSAELRSTQLWADRALRHEFHFFGASFVYGERIPWHQDPVSGREWPRLFHSDVPVQGNSDASLDVKYVWELNRHQFVQDLGKAYFVTGRPEYAAEARRLVLDWIEQNPVGEGVNWASPLEPAYRSLAWLWAYWFTLDDPALDAASHARWLEGFYDAGQFLSRHLELYASPYNHLLGEACALYAIGSAFPEFRESDGWRRQGRHVLVNRLSRQFYADGGTVEQATCYHHASLGFYVLAALLGRATSDEFPSEVWQAIERGIDFSVALMQPDGQMPAIGDTDDARPILLERRPLWDFGLFAAAGAVLFERGDFKHAAARFHEDALWLLGPPGWEKFERLETSPSPDSVCLPHSGYAVMRSDRSPGADYVCFDCGEQAGGLRVDDVPSAAHGHADCLSVVAWLGGRPVLVDSGFFTYNSDREWERYFRETAAHNTARINGRDQATHLEKMAWTRIPRASLELWRSDGANTMAIGSHDGYAREADGVVHRRSVWLRPGGYIIIHDEFAGGGSHAVELNYHLPPCLGILRGNAFRVEHAFELQVFARQALVAATASGGPGAADGWIAAGLGDRQAAPRVTYSASMPGSGLSLMTVVADLARVQVASMAGLPLTAIVAGANFTDVVIGADARTIARVDRPPDPIATDARVAVCRVQHGEVRERIRLDGTYLTTDDDRVLACVRSLLHER